MDGGFLAAEKKKVCRLENKAFAQDKGWPGRHEGG